MRVYYSKMNKTPTNVVAQEMQAINNEFGADAMLFHNGGVYNEDRLLEADVVIVTGYNGPYVGKGVFTEVMKAINNDIRVFQFSGDKDKLFCVNGACHNDTKDFFLRYGMLEYEYVNDEDDEVKLLTLFDIKCFVMGPGPACADNPETNLLY